MWPNWACILAKSTKMLRVGMHMGIDKTGPSDINLFVRIVQMYDETVRSARAFMMSPLYALLTRRCQNDPATT